MTEPNNTAQQIRAYQVDQLYTRMPTVAWLTFIIITLLVLILWPVINHAVLLVWWIATALLYAARWLLVGYYKRANPNPDEIEPWAERFLIGTTSAGLAWGAAGFFLFPEENLAFQIVLILIIAGMASMGVTTLSSVREDIVVFLCLMLIPPVFRLILTGSRLYLIMGSLVLLYLIGLLLTSRFMCNTYLEMITLRINSMQQAEKLKESEERYRDLFENATDLIQSVTPEGRFIFVNQAWRDTLGYSEEEIPTIAFFDVIHPDSQPHWKEILQRLISGEKVGKIEIVFVSKSGKEVTVEGSVSCRFKDDKPISTRSIFRDITKRKRAEEKIKAALQEKEILLKEIHHRVKNNLQTIVSLLNLQSGYIEDKKALEVFKNSKERVRVMALIHEKLYESKDLARIDFAEYLRSLINPLYESYLTDSNQVQLKMEVENVELDIDTSIPVGLIINELVSNSLKHAFPDKKKGELYVKLEENKDKGKDKEYDYTLIVMDNGMGFPADLDFRKSDRLGMLLINSLTKQLHGVVELDKNNGTTFTIHFKKLKYKKRI